VARTVKLVVLGVAATSALTASAAVSSAGLGANSTSEEVVTAGSNARVYVHDNFFDPRSLTVERGETVVWRWRGENRHNVVFTKVPAEARKKGAKSRREGKWRRTFWRRGLYKYVCTIHAGMKGSVLVE
jgi:plastocyanin